MVNIFVLYNAGDSFELMDVNNFEHVNLIDIWNLCG